MGRGRLCAALGVALLAAVSSCRVCRRRRRRAQARMNLTPSGGNQHSSPDRSSSRFRPNVDPLSRRLSRSSAESASTVSRSASLGAQLLRVDGSVAGRDRRARGEPGRRLRRAELDLPRRSRPERPALLADYGACRRSRRPRPGTSRPAAPASRSRSSTPASPATIPTSRPTWSRAANYVTGRRRTPASTTTATGRTSPARSARAATTAIGVAGVNWNVQPDAAPRAQRQTAAGRTHDIAAAFASTRALARPRSSTRAWAARATPPPCETRSRRCPNTLFVVAAGNDGTNNDTTPHYPCNYGAAPDNLAERDLRRRDRPERRACELLELRLERRPGRARA